MRGQRRFPRVLLLSLALALLTLPPSRVAAGSKMSPGRGGRRRDAEARGAHHRPLTDEQKADQNLQFMLSLYRSAAGPGGRPKQPRKFGSNTVRLLRPSASSVHYLPASRDHHYTFSVQYHVDVLPSEQLIRASFVHLRSSSSAALPSPRCHARVTWPGEESLLTTMEPHQRWTEADVGARALRVEEEGGRLTLTAQYWCTEQERAEEGGDLPRRWRGEPHLEAPSLLLYLEEERDGQDWMMGHLPTGNGEDLMRRLSRWHPFLRRRRSSASSPPDPSATPAPASVLANIPAAAKTKTATPKNRCKLHSFRLSFDELDWRHYIAPPVYNPRFCQGDCPRVLTYGYHSPNHAIIQTIINELGVGDVPPPSCVPYKYMPMSVLEVHKKKVEYKELEDMVAESCTCR
ncbi:bone morphogenetic protein 15 isoform X2 [Hippocampus zosterae]|uniref:bone morphogenetic protein 15 isoform X2 n=1 Tax=Hippocampus zosterae TaxID=109293 RepID=UPI00223E856B|nr:bone morphogenetic protein 15 isoform X2 [Hippocampus zosterae]